ncbi:MAG: hypothetical protein Q8908_09515, partial [Bacteroidota bacterium]|nr:hypothetical protein [Bacteroidota bacterium]
YYYKPFSDIMKCSYTVETAPDRKSVSVNLANLTPCDQIKPPGTATHFQFFLSIGVVCDMVFSPEYCDFKLAYGPPQFYGKGREIESEWIPVDAQAMGDITLTAAIPDAFNLKEDMTVLRMFGIVFGRMTSRVDPIAKDRGSCEFLGAI